MPTRGLGAARLVSTPSRKRFRAWLGIAISGFPDFEQFYAAGFPMGTQVLKSAASAISPRPREIGHSPIIKQAAKNYSSPAKQKTSTRLGPFVNTPMTSDGTETQAAGGSATRVSARPDAASCQRLAALTGPCGNRCCRRPAGIRPSRRRLRRSWSHCRAVGGA